MRQLGEKKNHHELYGTLLPSRFSSWRGRFFFFPAEKWKLSVKEWSVSCFGEAWEQQRRRRVCHWYKAVLCCRKMHWWTYVYPFKLADKGNCIFIHGKNWLYLNGFSLFAEINGLGVKPPGFFENRNYSRSLLHWVKCCNVMLWVLAYKLDSKFNSLFQ